MISILRKMQELVETIDLVSTSLSGEQQQWGQWWRRTLTTAIAKAIKSGWVEGGRL